MKLVNSSGIRAMEYSRKNKTLSVVFHNGRSYIYDNVPRNVADRLSARGVNTTTMFNKYIRNKFKFKKASPYTKWVMKTKSTRNVKLVELTDPMSFEDVVKDLTRVTKK